MDVIYKYEFSIWFPPSVFKFWKPFLVASIVAESEFQNSNIGREQIENAVLVASFEISCDLRSMYIIDLFLYFFPRKMH